MNEKQNFKSTKLEKQNINNKKHDKRCVQCDNVSCSLFLRLRKKNIYKPELCIDELMEVVSWKEIQPIKESSRFLPT